MEDNMQEQISNTPIQPSMPLSSPIKLWTPGFIAGVTFLLGFPAGIVIASINWMQMNLSSKALIHLVVGAVGTFIFLTVLILIPGNAGRAVGLLVNLGMLFYLRQQMIKDLAGFKVSNNVQDAGQLGGCLIGLGMVVLYLMLVFAIGIVFTLLGVPIPE
jgi:hypothetical protein